MTVNEEVHADDVPSGTRVMSGRWVETTKAPTVWQSMWAVRSYEEPHSDLNRPAATATIQGVRKVFSRCAHMSDKVRSARGYTGFSQR